MDFGLHHFLKGVESHAGVLLLFDIRDASQILQVVQDVLFAQEWSIGVFDDVVVDGLLIQQLFLLANLVETGLLGAHSRSSLLFSSLHGLHSGLRFYHDAGVVRQSASCVIL